ncbi:MAG: hypothetical protein JWN80_1853 [Microbacteriaceae bacterium]|jgi:hypothetical protein|nr:hypothetical protein [Microbacteriaceae bacterium]
MSIKRMTIAVVAGVAVFAGVSASAATLGGIKTDDLGANSNAVAAQLTSGAGVKYTVGYDATANAGAGAYKVTGVTVAPIGATESFGAGSAINLTLKGASGVSLAEFTGAGIAGAGPTTGLVTLTEVGTTVIPAYDVIGASLVVNGGAVTALVSTNK